MEKKKLTWSCWVYACWTFSLSSYNLSRKRNFRRPYFREKEERLTKDNVAKTERDNWTIVSKGLTWSSSQFEQANTKWDTIGTPIARRKKTDQERPALHRFEWSRKTHVIKPDLNPFNSTAASWYESCPESEFCFPNRSLLLPSSIASI